MNMKKIIMICAAIVSFLGFAHGNAHGTLPEDFPDITVTTYDANAVADGRVFLAVSEDIEGIGKYLMILENDGAPYWYRKVDSRIYDFKMLPNGFLHYAPFIESLSFAGGGTVTHEILDPDYNHRETIQAGNGFIAEAHDFQMLPNGHILLFGYYLIEVDMSKVVPGGKPHAIVAGTAIQELDTKRNVVFQWRTWDHQTPEEYFLTLQDDPKAIKPVINAFHVNAMSLDYDGHILIGTPKPGSNLSDTSGWIKKINRQTGETMWHLAGTENEFTFVGISEEEALQALAGHAFHRLPNGNVLIYDNGKTRTSRVFEFSLDETNKVATYIWSYIPSVTIKGNQRGNAQRLPNGNTFIGWGGLNQIPDATEVTRDGQVVFDLNIDVPVVVSYRSFRNIWPPSQAIVVTQNDLAASNTYVFTDGDQITGVTIDVDSLTGDVSNQVTVTREAYAPIYPEFPGKSPLALPIRVKMEATGITEISADISFDAESFDLIDSIYFDNPSVLTLYHRETPGSGEFSALTTGYDAGTKQLIATTTNSGEFIFCYADLADVADYPPILNQVENYRGIQGERLIYPYKAETGVVYQVNQERPIFLSWTPRGFARSYKLQVATDENFNYVVVDEPYLKEARYILETAEHNTTYYYRVNTTNYGGTSDWSTGSFRTVPPMIEVTAPNGGEQWNRGLDFFIQWNDNIAEDVVIELYKDDTLVRTIGTVPSDRAHEWEVFLDLEPGCGYSIKVRSSADEDLFDMSDHPFGIDASDTTPPEFEFSVTPTVLWPSNHKMVEIAPSWTVSDETDATPEVSLVSIVANEGDDTIGDGHTSGDIQIGEDGSIYLRAERSGTGSGRIYTITYKAVDDCGNVTVRSATVTVPHDKRK